MSTVVEKLWRKERLKAAFSIADSIKILDLFAQNAQDKINTVLQNSWTGPPFLHWCLDWEFKADESYALGVMSQFLTCPWGAGIALALYVCPYIHTSIHVCPHSLCCSPRVFILFLTGTNITNLGPSSVLFLLLRFVFPQVLCQEPPRTFQFSGNISLPDVHPPVIISLHIFYVCLLPG